MDWNLGSLVRGQSYPFVWNKYDKQLEQVCKSIQCISMAVLLGCVMLKVSLYKYYENSTQWIDYNTKIKNTFI